MTSLLQDLINGLTLGAVYAGLALGLSLVLGILGIVNVAHSAFIVLAALVYWELVNGLGLDPLVAIIPLLLVFAFFGAGLYSGFVRRVERENDTTALLVFFGVMVVVESVAVIVWTTDTRNVRLGYLGETLRFAGLNVPLGKLTAGVLTLVLFGLLHLFLTRTVAGIAIRGMAQNRDVAEMVGIPVRSVAVGVFALGTAFAAFGGAVLALTAPFSPQEHYRWLTWAFIIVIIGGLGSVANTLIAGLALGMLETFVGGYFSFQYTYLVVYLLLPAALIWRRHGLRGVSARAV